MNLQERVKTTSVDILVLFIRLLTGGILGLTIALILQEIFRYQSLAFVLVVSATGVAFFKLSKGWGLSAVLIFDLVCVLVGLLLRMYILVAPGA